MINFSDKLNDYGSGLGEDYEEGEMIAIDHAPVRKKWYQFWLPKNYDCCRYTKIGNRVRVTTVGGRSFTDKEEKTR